MSENNTTSNESWFTFSNIFIAIAMILLLSLTIWNESIAEALFVEEAPPTVLPEVPDTLGSSVVNIPEEFYSDPASSAGIIFGVVIILVIVFGSAIWKLLTEKA